MQTDKRPYRLNVGIVLLNHQNKIWVGSRLDGKHNQNKNPTSQSNKITEQKTYWQMPQGGIDQLADGSFEDTKTAMFRELYEETGLDENCVEILKVSKIWLTYDIPKPLSDKLWNGKYRGQKQKWFALRLIAPDSSINLATHTPEFDNYKWSAKQTVIAEIVTFKKNIYKQILGEFASLLK